MNNNTRLNIYFEKLKERIISCMLTILKICKRITCD